MCVQEKQNGKQIKDIENIGSTTFITDSDGVIYAMNLTDISNNANPHIYTEGDYIVEALYGEVTNETRRKVIDKMKINSSLFVENGKAYLDQNGVCKEHIYMSEFLNGIGRTDSVVGEDEIKTKDGKIYKISPTQDGKYTIAEVETTTEFSTADPDETITIDGVNILDISEECLRKNISIIRQDPFIFNRTIMENFKIVDEDIKLKEVKACIKEAYLDEYIESLPKKYDTVLGEGGVNLSGGQKQRLAIARTLAKKSKIILFDEATSALDNNSQEFIKKSIDNLVKDHTVVIVAHRLSTIIDADIIYVIDDGKVIASGTHKTLLKSCDYYKNLYKTEM